MKKALRAALILTLAVLCLTLCAAAADAPSGIYNVTSESGFTLTPLDAQGSVVSAGSVPADLSGAANFYPGAVKVQVSFSSVSGSQYLALALNDESQVPTESNVSYIDQVPATGETAVLTIYPGQMESGKTYAVWLSSNAETGSITTLTKAGSFAYYAPYTPGDVDEDGEITATDARYALALSVGSATSPKGEAWSENQRLAAEVDGDTSGITATDARYILEAVVGKRSL